MAAGKNNQVNSAEEVRPSCLCCDIKTGLLIWIGLTLISQLATAFTLKGILMGGYLVGAFFTLIGFFGAYKENSKLLKVFFWSEILYLIAIAAFQIILINTGSYKEFLTETCTTANNLLEGTTTRINCEEFVNSVITNSYISLAIGMILPIVVIVHVRKFYTYLDSKSTISSA